MSASTAESLWNPAEIGYFDPSRSGNAIGDVYQFIDRFITVAFATNFDEVQANLHTCLLGPAEKWYKVLPDYHKKMLCDRARNWIAALLERFDTEYRNKDYYHCLSRADHIYQQLERKYVEDRQRAQHKQRQCDNERRKQQRLERVKHFEEQEIARQQHEMEQQRIREKQEMEQQRIREKQEMERQKRLDDQEMERQIAEQKAKNEAFACRRCPEKFSSNTKLHKHIAAHHIKPARASSEALAPAQAMAISSSVPPTPPTSPKPAISSPPTPFLSSVLATSAIGSTPLSPPTSTLFSWATFSTPSTPPKIAKAFSPAPLTRPTTPRTPTSPTTPKIAKSTCAMPAAYMTIEDLFWKFAAHTIQHQHTTELRPQSLQTPLPSPIPHQATVARSFATLSAFDKRARSSKSAPNLAYIRFTAGCQKSSTFAIPTCFAAACHAIPTWEWTKQFELRLRAWALL